MLFRPAYVPLGGFVAGTTLFPITPASYIDTTLTWLQFRDILSGLIKSAVFAVIVSMVGCYRALTVEGGPRVFGVPVLPVLGLAGYLMAFLNSLWIIYGIWRSGRE